MHTSRRPNRLALVFAASLALLLSGQALGITWGSPDGDDHPYVGAYVITTEDGETFPICSGTMLSPTIFVTAAHCPYAGDLFFGPHDTFVTLESDWDPDGDPQTWTGLHAGTPVAHPAFPGPQSDPYDLAVVILDEPVALSQYGQLPTAGLLTDVARQNGLKGQEFTNVGYGALERTIGEGRPAFGFDTLRRQSTSTFQSLTRSWLTLSQQPSTGDGGTCYGDSGGPQFLGGPESNLIVSITITGDAQCTATNRAYRLDTPVARDFLGQFVELP